MCVTARAGGRAPHETQSIFNYFGTGARNRGATTGYSGRSQGTLASALLHRTAATHQPRPAGVRALAYRMQEQALGGLKPSTHRLLAKVAAAASAHRPMRMISRCTLHWSDQAQAALPLLRIQMPG